MIITWAEAARQDIEDIHAYIARDSITSATKVVEAIVAATERLTLFPAMGRPGRQSGTRELIVPRLPYVVPYRVRRDRVVILRVLHTSWQWAGRVAPYSHTKVESTCHRGRSRGFHLGFTLVSPS